MRMTVTIDDAKYDKALELADPDLDKSEIFQEALRTYVRVQTAKCLHALGSSTPDLDDDTVSRQRLTKQPSITHWANGSSAEFL
jgi:Bacterial antitoxin of type II TA system, VapB